MADTPCPRCGCPQVVRKHCPDGLGTTRCTLGVAECHYAIRCAFCPAQWLEPCGKHVLVLGA